MSPKSLSPRFLRSITQSYGRDLRCRSANMFRTRTHTVSHRRKIFIQFNELRMTRTTTTTTATVNCGEELFDEWVSVRRAERRDNIGTFYLIFGVQLFSLRLSLLFFFFFFSSQFVRVSRPILHWLAPARGRMFNWCNEILIILVNAKRGILLHCFFFFAFKEVTVLVLRRRLLRVHATFRWFY